MHNLEPFAFCLKHNVADSQDGYRAFKILLSLAVTQDQELYSIFDQESKNLVRILKS
jgi:hypothetical protein